MVKKERINRRKFLKVGVSAFIAWAVIVTGFGFPFIVGAANVKLKDPIKIAGQAINTGPQGMNGLFMQEGARLAIDEINAKGGILGSKIEFAFRDEENRSDITVKNARYFVNTWGADFIIGGETSGTCLALGEIMPELNRILIVYHGSTNRLNEDLVYKRNFKQIFRVSLPLYHDAIGGAFLVNDWGLKRYGAIIPDYEYGHVCWKLFKKTLKTLQPDAEFVAETFAKMGTVDYSSHIMKVMAAKPEVFMTFEWGGGLVALIKQANLYGVNKNVKAWMSPMAAQMDSLISLGREYPEGIWGSNRYWFLYPDTAKNKDFVSKYYTRYNKYPSQGSENAYTAIYMIKQGVERAKSLEIDQLIKAMEGMELDRPAGPCYIRKEDHQAIFSVPWGQITQDPKYPMPILTNLKVYPAEKIFPKPPFPPID